jgi:hypothetical protein
MEGVCRKQYLHPVHFLELLRNRGRFIFWDSVFHKQGKVDAKAGRGVVPGFPAGGTFELKTSFESS